MPIKISPAYPHMMILDIMIWQKFIENGDYLPDLVWYDLHCGQGIPIDVNSPDWMHKMANGIGRKRIDVVGRVGLDYWVIEVKPNANYEAFGQVIFYADLFQREFRVETNVLPVIITDVVDADLISIANDTGVLILETEPVLSPGAGSF